MNETITWAHETVQEMRDAELTRVFLTRYLDRLKTDLNYEGIPARSSGEVRQVESMIGVAECRADAARTELLSLVQRLFDTIADPGEGLSGNPKGGE